MEIEHYCPFLAMQTQKSLVIGIDGESYDLTNWASSHPGGEKILGLFSGQDGTEAFFSLHSKAAVERFKRMRPTESKLLLVSIDVTAFRGFREQMVSEGWFQRNLLHEIFLTTMVLGMWIAGLYLAYDYPVAAIILLAVAMQQAGWLGHDWAHARNNTFIEYFSPVIYGWINGFDIQWWSDKHNTHHVMTNNKEVDPDINNQPVLFLWSPPKALDTHYRKYQHLYFLPVYTVLYASWRLQSFQWAIAHGNYARLVFGMLPSYIWLVYLPLWVSVGSVLLSGWLVAMVVTVSHESEELLDERDVSYARTQFRTTRDVICPDWITEYLFGGMQYQLIHHLFPTLPRYYYPRLVPKVQEFAAKNNLTYKRDGIVTMFRDLYSTLKKNALAQAK